MADKQFVHVSFSNDFCRTNNKKGYKNSGVHCTMSTLFVWFITSCCWLLRACFPSFARSFLLPFIKRKNIFFGLSASDINLSNGIHATILRNYYLEWFLHVSVLVHSFDCAWNKCVLCVAETRFNGSICIFSLCARNQNNKNTLALHFVMYLVWMNIEHCTMYLLFPCLNFAVSLSIPEHRLSRRHFATLHQHMNNNEQSAAVFPFQIKFTSWM